MVLRHLSASGGEGAGVSSLNSLTGDVTLSEGSNITFNIVGNDIEISSTGGGGSGTIYDATQLVFGDGSTAGGVTSPNLIFDENILAVSTNGEGSGWGQVQFIIDTSGTEAGLSFLNEGTGGRQYNIISTSDASDVGGGNFSIGDATAGQNRLMINSSGNVTISDLAGGGDRYVAVDNTGILSATSSIILNSTPTQVLFFDGATGNQTNSSNFVYDNTFAGEFFHVQASTGDPDSRVASINLSLGGISLNWAAVGANNNGIAFTTTGVTISSHDNIFLWPTAFGTGGSNYVFLDALGNGSLTEVDISTLIPTPTLTQNQIAVGDSSSLLSSSSNLTYDPSDSGGLIVNRSGALTTPLQQWQNGGATTSDIEVDGSFKQVSKAGSGTQIAAFDNSGVLGTTTINQAPVYSVNQVVYGDGSTPGGVTDGNFTRDPMGNFNLSSAGTIDLISAGNMTLDSDLITVGAGSGNATKTVTNNTTQIITTTTEYNSIPNSIIYKNEWTSDGTKGREFRGDISGSQNHTIQSLNDFVQIISESTSYNGQDGTTFLSEYKTDGSVGLTTIGDVDSVLNSTKITINDVSRFVALGNLTSGGTTKIVVDTATPLIQVQTIGQFIAGDGVGSSNNTYEEINDNNQQISFNSFSSTFGQLITGLFLDFANDIYSIGDTQGVANGTALIVDDNTGNYTLNKLGGFGSGFVAVDNSGILSWSAGSGGGGSQDLQSVTDIGNTTTDEIVVASVSINGSTPTTGSGFYLPSTNNLYAVVDTATTVVFNGTSSDVNYFRLQSQVSGAAPNWVAEGADTDVSFNLVTKGAGIFTFYTEGGSGVQARITDTTNAINYVNLTGGATGDAAVITVGALGDGLSDTNADIIIQSKGTGLTRIAGGSGNGTEFQIDDNNQQYIANKLSGTGTRLVTASNTGILAANISMAATTYTPTLTGVTNVSASTPHSSSYSRIGSVVTVFGSLDVTTTLAVATEIDISLPIASNFAATTDANGLGSATSAIATNAYIDADATNDRVRLKFIGLSVGGAGTIFYSFNYNVI